jgi:hypothetical protein
MSSSIKEMHQSLGVQMECPVHVVWAALMEADIHNTALDCLPLSFPLTDL